MQGAWLGGGPEWLWPLEKTSTFEFAPHPAQGVHTQTRWSLAWGDLTYPLPHARNHMSLAHHGAAQWEGEVGPHWPRLRTSCLGQPGPRGQEGVLLWVPPAPPHCLGRWPLHPPRLSFQGSGALANTPGVATWMLGLISARLTGNQSHGEGHLLWRGWVGGIISQKAVQAWVKHSPLSQFSLKNEPGPICSKLTGDLHQMVGRCALKMASGYHPPPGSSAALSKCAK